MSRLAVVTGANGVFGRYICKGLAAKGFKVIGVVRDAKKGEALVKWIGGDASYAIADLSSRQSIRDFANNLGQVSVHCLINNAAIVPDEREQSADGEELQWCVNVMSYHRLTTALLPQLKLAVAEGASPRVVFVASFYAGGLNLDDLEFKRRPYEPGAAYQASKQANRMLAHSWAQQLSSAGVGVASCHPGIATSNVSLGCGFDLDRSEEAQQRGAETPVHLAVASDFRSGAYYNDKRVARCEFSGDTNACDRLWQICETAC